MEIANNVSEYITQTALLQRDGWTKTVIKKLNFQPDVLKNHYLYGKHCNIKLFSIKKVEEKERSKEFIELMYGVQKRKARAQRGVQTKVKNILQKIISLPITVKRVENVTNLALTSYNDWNAQRMYSYVTFASASQAFLDRISVNYIRHNLTKYGENIEELCGKVGRLNVYDVERFLVLSEIASVYPEFAAECRRQYLQKHCFIGLFM